MLITHPPHFPLHFTPHTQNKHMQHFFEDVDLIKSDIACIRNATKQIEKIDEEAMMATTSEMEKVRGWLQQYLRQ